MGTGQQQEQEEEKIVSVFFQKVRSYKEGKCKGKSTQLDDLSEVREHWVRMYKWIIVIMAFIDKMKHEQSKDMRTKNMKCILYVAAVAGIQEGRDNLVDPQMESGENFARRILEVLKQIRREKLRNKEEEDNETKENGLARVPHQARREDDTKTDEKGGKGEPSKPNPQQGVMLRQINRFSNKKPKEKIRQELRRPVLNKENKIDFTHNGSHSRGSEKKQRKGKNTCPRGKTEDHTSN